VRDGDDGDDDDGDGFSIEAGLGHVVMHWTKTGG
jgi:hypothetical protein